MPIMKPEHQKAMLNAQKLMAQAGVPGAAPIPSDGEEFSVKDILSQSGLDLRRAIENLADTANHSSNEGLRTRANETALKIHGVLKETVQAAVPSFTIVIQDPFQDPAKAPEAINPIFLPRQILHTVEPTKEKDTSIQ